MKKCDFVSVGKIVKPHGKRGEVKVILYSKEGRRNFKEGKRVCLEFEEENIEEEVEAIRKVSGKGKVFVVKLKGVNSRERAYRLSGYQIKIKEQDLEELEEDVFYQYQIIGCSVWDKENNLIGEVEEIISAGENEVLVVKKGEKEYFIPFVKSICIKVDIRVKKIIVNPPEGLLNLNEI